MCKDYGLGHNLGERWQPGLNWYQRTRGYLDNIKDIKKTGWKRKVEVDWMWRMKD